MFPVAMGHLRKNDPFWKKGGGQVKRHPRRKMRTGALPAAIWPAAPVLLLLLCLFAPPAAAQTRTEEEIDTGRFGAEEPEDSGAAPGKDINDKWLRLGFRMGPSLRFYTPSNDTPYTGGDTYAVSMDLALQANLRLLPFLSIQAEAVFTWDNASFWAYYTGTDQLRHSYTNDYTVFSFQFPLLVKFDFYPGNFKISPFFGGYCLAPLGNLKASNSLGGGKSSLSWRVSPPLGLLAGISGTRKMGPGAIIADLRYAADLGGIEARNGGTEEFRRGMISLTVGYELGFFTRKGGARE
jgi:hypothetical protein